jgi:hypothetical protein
MSAAISAYWIARDYKLAHNKLPTEYQTPQERRMSSATPAVPAHVSEKRNSSISSSVRKMFNSSSESRRASDTSGAEKEKRGSIFSRKH